MFARGYLSGNAGIHKRYKIGASFLAGGIIAQAGTGAGVIPPTTTSMLKSPGFAYDPATYSTTQGDIEGATMVDVNPNLVVMAKISGGATKDTALSVLTNTSASAGGTTVTDATNVGAASMATGYLWCIAGNNVSLSRVITTFNTGASEVVTVPFPRAIAVGDQFVQLPWADEPGTGSGNLQTTTDFTQANQLIVAGTGASVTVFRVGIPIGEMPFVEFTVQDHIFRVSVI